MTSAQREFLVQRLMEDSQKMRKSTTPVRHKPRANSSDSDEHSDSSSDQGCGVAVRNGLDSENATVPSLLTVGTNGGHVLDAVAGRLGGMSAPSASSLFTGSPLQYAATLVSLAQMNFLPPAAASTLPLLYPHLYQSLLTMPNFDRLRFQQQQQLPTELLSRLAGKTPEKFPVDNSCGVVTTSLSTTTTPVVTPKLGANHATPSPRKRSSQTAKNVDPKKSSDPFADYGNGGVDTPKKPRAIRKIQFDDEKSSPVSGMYIKDASDVAVDECASNGNELLNGSAGGAGHQQEMLLHESADFVQITEEAKKQLAKITNVIGDYVCQLCKLKYDDAFRLAMHKCPRIGHKIYRCPECDKVFSCPANLASHRRWHRPKDDAGSLGKSPAKCQASENNGVVAKLQNQFQRKNISSFIPPLDSPVSFATDDDPVADGPVDLTSKSEPATSTVVEADDVIDSGDQQVDISVFSENGALAYFQCEFCKKKFDCHRLLRSHAISHTSFADCGVDGDDANDPETRCDQCDLWFLSRDCYEKHARRSHPKFLCKFCRESFPTSPALTRHINKRHPNAECRSTAFAQDYVCTSDHVISALSK